MNASPRPLVLRGGRLLDLADGTAPATDILVTDGTIAAVGPPGLAAPDDAEAVDARDRLVIPGLVNAHTHGHGPFGKGLLGDRAILETFLAGIAPTLRERTLEEKYLGGLLNALDMIENGITACFDMFSEFPTPTLAGVTAIGRAYEETGLRAVIAPMMADLTIFQAIPGLIDALPEPQRSEAAALRAAPFEAHVAACREIFAHWPFGRDQVRPGIAPTIPLHCTDPFLVACRDLAHEHDLPVQIHLAETKVQADAAALRYGHSLTAHLDELGLLGRRLSVAHGIWLDADDIAALARSGTTVVHNPASNARLGSGIAPVVALRRAGVRVALGTDACNTSDHMSLFEVQRLASYLSRLATPHPADWLTPAEVIAMATTGGAAALGEEARLGRIAPGYAADIVLLDLGRVRYAPLQAPLTQLVFGENGSAVTDTIIGGRPVYRNGRHTTVDIAALRQKVAAAATRLRPSMDHANAFIRSIEAPIQHFCRGPHPPSQSSPQP